MFKEHIKPIVVLVVICLVATVLLAATYGVANPMITANQAAADNAARAEVLPEGDSFSPTKVKLIEGVTSCYIADNGTGMAIQTQSKGFGGAVVSIVGINANGEITGIKVTDLSNETPGLGTKAAEAGYLDQFIATKDHTAGHVNDDATINAISGATITSNAVYGDVVLALKQFKECGGVK